jgi:hypothetical protein
MMTKIDILFSVNELISVVEDNTQILKISTLEGDDLRAYQSFIDMINNKEHIEYNQIFITDYYVKRYALILQEDLIIKEIEEVLYDNLSDSEKLIFDNFYNTFTSWQ